MGKIPIFSFVFSSKRVKVSGDVRGGAHRTTRVRECVMCYCLGMKLEPISSGAKRRTPLYLVGRFFIACSHVQCYHPRQRSTVAGSGTHRVSLAAAIAVTDAAISILSFDRRVAGAFIVGAGRGVGVSRPLIRQKSPRGRQDGGRGCGKWQARISGSISLLSRSKTNQDREWAPFQWIVANWKYLPRRSTD